MRFSNKMLVAGLAIGLVSTACKKAEKTPGTGSATGSAPATGSGSAAVTTTGSATGSAETKAEAPATGSGTAQAAAGTPANVDDLKLLPVSSELIMGINFKQMQTSALWKKFVEPQLAKNMGELEKFKAKCGFNPLDTIESMAMGLSNVGPNQKPSGAVVVHGLEKTKMMDCFDKMKDEMKEKGTEVTKDGDFVVIDNTKEGMKSTATFVNDTTMLMAVGGDKDTVAKLMKGDAGAKSSPMFVDMFGKLDSSHTVWGLMNGSSKLFAPLAGANIKFKAVYGSINVTDGVQVEARARMDSADQAQALATMANGKAAQMKGMVDKLEIGTDDKDVKASVFASAQKLETLLALAGMGGGGGGGGMAPPGP